VFGEAADDYDAYRPGYPEQLVDDVIAAAGPGPALEIGAGTGKATAAFAARGLDLTCLEPDPRMAAMLHRNVPAVPIVTTQFETWTPDRRYGLLYSAQAWHWIDPERRTELAYAALAPGGLVALFWNVFMLADKSLHEALTEVDGRYIPAAEPVGHSWLTGDRPREIKVFAEEWPELALHHDTRFTDLRTRRYVRGRGLRQVPGHHVDLPNARPRRPRRGTGRDHRGDRGPRRHDHPGRGHRPGAGSPATSGLGAPTKQTTRPRPRSTSAGFRRPAGPAPRRPR
jgi:SAM-dependent methyltransferase